MKKNIIITIVVLLVFPSVCWGVFDMTQWKYFKEVNLGLLDNNGLIKIAIDDEIFSGANSDLSDIRVVSGDTKEVPFKVVVNKQESNSSEHSIKIINNSFVPGKNSSAIVDLGEKGRLTNSLSVKTASENFQRNVIIYGSDDMNNWNVLRDKAYIYDYTDRKGNLKTQNTTVSFPESAFRYLKLEILDENNNPVRIDSVAARQEVVEKNREIERHPQLSISENTQNKSTEIITDLGVSGVPVSGLTLQTENINFNRGVLIYSSVDNKDWKLLGQSYIFRYSTAKFSGENLRLNFPETSNQYLKVEILNKDNDALVVKGAVAHSIYREIIFQGEKNQNYKIFYGNKKAEYPEYDLDKYFQYLDIDSAHNGSLSPQKNNVDYVPEKELEKPISERVPYLFSAIMALTSVMLLLLVYKFLKK